MLSHGLDHTTGERIPLAVDADGILLTEAPAVLAAASALASEATMTDMSVATRYLQVVDLAAVSPGPAYDLLKADLASLVLTGPYAGLVV